MLFTVSPGVVMRRRIFSWTIMARRKRFLELVRKALGIYQVVPYVYVLMRDHFWRLHWVS